MEFRQENEITDIQIGKEKAKLSPFEDSMILFYFSKLSTF